MHMKNILIILSVWLSMFAVDVVAEKASSQHLLGFVVTKEQNNEGYYWLQVAALKNASSIEKKLQGDGVNHYKIHNDSKGLKRIILGPYASFDKATQVKRQLEIKGYNGLFIRFENKKVVQKATSQADASTAPLIDHSNTVVSDFIKNEKIICNEITKKGSTPNQVNCVCCLHIKNNNLIKHN